MQLVRKENLPVKETGEELQGTFSGNYEDVFFVLASPYAAWTF